MKRQAREDSRCVGCFSSRAVAELPSACFLVFFYLSYFSSRKYRGSPFEQKEEKESSILNAVIFVTLREGEACLMISAYIHSRTGNRGR